MLAPFFLVFRRMFNGLWLDFGWALEGFCKDFGNVFGALDGLWLHVWWISEIILGLFSRKNIKHYHACLLGCVLACLLAVCLLACLSCAWQVPREHTSRAIWGVLLMFTASRLLPAGNLNYTGECCWAFRSLLITGIYIYGSVPFNRFLVA